MTNPLVSIVIPTFTNVDYDQKDLYFEVETEQLEFLESARPEDIERYLKMLQPEVKLPRVLISFLEQPYVPFEIIVVDDGTPFRHGINVVETIIDKIRERIANQPDKRLIYIRKPNGGQATAFNRGLEEASGKYYMPFNDDDFVCATWLLNSVYYMESQPDVDYVYSDYMYTYDWQYFKRALPPPEPWDRNALRDHQIAPVIGLYRMDVARKLKWDEELPHEEDWDYLLQFSKHGEAVYLPEIYSFVIFKHLASKSIYESGGVKECHAIIEQRIREGYYG